MTNRKSRTNKFVSRSWGLKRVKKSEVEKKKRKTKSKIKQKIRKRYYQDSRRIQNILNKNPNYCYQKVIEFSVKNEGDEKLYQELDNKIKQLKNHTQVQLTLWCQRNKNKYNLVDILKK